MTLNTRLDNYLEIKHCLNKTLKALFRQCLLNKVFTKETSLYDFTWPLILILINCEFIEMESSKIEM